MKMLQNQAGFVAPEYRQAVVPLKDAIRDRSLLSPCRRWNLSGFLGGGIMYLLCNGYDGVVTVGHRSSLAFGLLNRLAPRMKVHIVKEIWLGESNSRGWKRLLKGILQRVYRFGFAKVSKVIVTSRSEIETYADILSLPPSCFEFIPWPSNIDVPRMVKSHQGYILAAGRSLRDWETFFRAVSEVPCKVVAIGARSDLEGMEIPGNVTLFCDIPHGQYLKLLEGSRIVIVPLLKSRRSAGQAAFLEAMALGKPVIVAQVTGAADYLEDGRNALLYPPGNSEALKDKILGLLSDSDLSERISSGALNSIREQFNKRAYALRVLEIAARSVEVERKNPPSSVATGQNKG